MVNKLNVRGIIVAIFFVIFTLSVLPEPASAQSIVGGICDGPDCNSCHLVDLGNNLIQWLIGVITVLFGVLMVIAGFGLVTSGGNPSALQSAKDKFINALVGFLIVLSAWLLIDTIMRSLLPGDTGQINGTLFWAEVECYSANASSAVPIDFPDAGTDGAVPPDSAALAAYIAAGGVLVESPGGSSCFPGANGVIDGPPAFTPSSDDICIDTTDLSGGSYNLPDGSGLGYTPPPGYFGPDVIATNPQISPSFRLCDLTNCDSARRSGDYVYIDPFMVAQLEGVEADLGGFTVNSGYRSPAYNAGVDGATHSRHQYGDAVDIAVTGSNTEASIMASCRARGATNIYTYASGAHVHCDWRGAAR